jgi:hypothetical protein
MLEEKNPFSKKIRDMLNSAIYMNPETDILYLLFYILAGRNPDKVDEVMWLIARISHIIPLSLVPVFILTSIIVLVVTQPQSGHVEYFGITVFAMYIGNILMMGAMLLGISIQYWQTPALSPKRKVLGTHFGQAVVHLVFITVGFILAMKGFNWFFALLPFFILNAVALILYPTKRRWEDWGVGY